MNWNVTRKFDRKKNSEFAFVAELMAALGAKRSFPAPVMELLADVAKKNSDKFDLTFSAEWAVVPGDKKAKKHKFKTHAELDEWVLVMRKEHPNLEAEHADDWSLLLLMDRLFWCGQESPDLDAMNPRDKARSEGCPFGPPAFHKVLEMDLGGGHKRGQIIRKKTPQ